MAVLFNQDFFDSLNKAQVEYIIFGGYAVILYSFSRTTGDMDVWVNKILVSYQKLKKAFLLFGAQQRKQRVAIEIKMILSS